MIRNLLVIVSLILAGCATTEGTREDDEPNLIVAVPDPVPESEAEEVAAVAEEDPKPTEESKQQEGELPVPVAAAAQAEEGIAEVVVQAGIRNRQEAIHNLVTEGRELLKDVELRYVLSGKGKRDSTTMTASTISDCSLAGSATHSVQPEATSVSTSVWTKEPTALVPQCVTRSISIDPGRVSSQSAKVLTATSFRTRLRGFFLRLAPNACARTCWSRRSIVAALRLKSRSRIV